MHSLATSVLPLRVVLWWLIQHLSEDIKLHYIKGVIMANTNNNTTTTSFSDLGLNLKLFIGTPWNLLLAGNKLLAIEVRKYELGKALDRTNLLDLLKGDGEFIILLTKTIANQIDKMMASITYSDSKMTEDEFALAIATVDAIPGLEAKDRNKAILAIKKAIHQSKRSDAANDVKGAKEALKTEVEKAVDVTAMEAWKIANP